MQQLARSVIGIPTTEIVSVQINWPSTNVTHLGEGSPNCGGSAKSVQGPQRDVSPPAVKQVRALARPVCVVRLLPDHPSFTIGIVYRHPVEVFAFLEDIADPRKGDVCAGDEITFRNGLGEGDAAGLHRP